MSRSANQYQLWKNRFRSFWDSSRKRFGVTAVGLILAILIEVAALSLWMIGGETLAEVGIAEQLESGESLSVGARIYRGNRVAAMFVIALGVVLLATTGFWARRFPEAAAPFRPNRVGKACWIVLLLAVTIAAFLRAPRLEHSLWNDEEVAVRKFIVGGYRTDPETGNLEFRSVPLERTLYYSLSGNNHITQSVASRIGNDLWKQATDANQGAFSESALRMGSFLAGLGTIFLTGFWLAREGFPRAGVVSALILALHPWHSRYAVEARGYSLLLFFVVLMFFLLRPAISNGQWRHWLGFGIAQALALLSFAASIFLIIPINLSILFLLGKNRDRTGIRRWFFVTVAGAALVVWFLMPTVLGSMGWLESLAENDYQNDWEHLREFLSHVMLGVHWQPGNPEMDYGVGIRDLTAQGPVFRFLILLALPSLTILGAWSGIRRSLSARVLIVSTLAAIFIIAVFREFSDQPFHVWYAVYAMLCFTVSLGFVAEIQPAKNEGQKAISPCLANWGSAAAMVFLFAWLSWKPNLAMREHPRHPIREAVAAVHGDAPATSTDSAWITAAVGAGAGQFRLYDPRVRTPERLEDLLALREEATQTGRRLAIYVVGPRQMERARPEIMAELDRPEFFESSHLIKGIEEFWSIRIFESKHPWSESSPTG